MSFAAGVLPTAARRPKYAAMSATQGADLLRRTAGVLPLRSVSFVRVSGDDAVTWLQGQVTNDVLSLREGAAVYALLLDAQGKVLSDLHVYRRADDVLLLFPRERCDAMFERLDRYVVMEDVDLERLVGLRVITVQGPLAARVIEGLPGAFVVDRLGSGGVDILVSDDEGDVMLATLVERARALSGDRVDADAFELARVRAGRAKLGVDFGATTLPQEAGLGAIAVSFLKGCYVGQEPVVMLEHRGKPPKRLVRFDVDAALVGRAPLEIHAGTDSAGTLTSVVADPESSLGAVALGLVKRARLERGDTLTTEGSTLVVVGIVGSPVPSE